MFKLAELIKATRGNLIQGDAEGTVAGISLDSRCLRPAEAFLAIKGRRFDANDFIAAAVKKKAGCIISDRDRQPGFPSRTAYIKVKDAIRALGDIARYQRLKFDIPLVAVTGSNGKTTVKEMLSWVLCADARVLKNEGTKNNHIGLPQALAGMDKRYDFAVLEIGTNHFGEVSYLADICLPNIGIITNIAESHLEFFATLDGVFREKSQLLAKLKKPAVCVLNADDDYLRRLSRRSGSGAYNFTYGIKHACDFRATSIESRNGKVFFTLNGRHEFTLDTPGECNVYNALAAISAARILGLGYADIRRRLAIFEFPAGRLKLMRLAGVNFIDDTYNSNPFSMRRALEALANFKVKGRKILVMGDMLELGSRKESLHKEIGRSITSICDIFVSVGRLSGLSAQEAKQSGFSAGNIFSCADSIQARELLFKKILPSACDIILVKGSRSMKMEEVFKL